MYALARPVASLTGARPCREDRAVLARAFFLSACLLACPALASAQQSVMIDGVRPELHLGIGWGGQLGFGGRVDVPVAPQGALSGFDDEIALSPGGDVYLHTSGDGHVAFDVVLPVQWNFYLDPRWSVFPELGAALGVGSRKRGEVALALFFAAGVRHHLGRRNALVLRLAWPHGVQLGFTF
jgi:hypothetical protein